MNGGTHSHHFHGPAAAIGPGEPPAKEHRGPSPIGRLLAPVRGALIVACIMQAVSSAAGVVPFIAVAELGRVFLAAGPLDEARAWTVAGVGAGALVVRLVFLLAASGLTHFADVDFQLSLRRKMAERLSRVPLGWFTERNAGQIKKALQDDVTAIHHLVGHGYTNLVSAVVTPLVALVYLLWIDWRLTLVVVVPLVLGIVFLFGMQMRGYREKMAAYNSALGKVNASSVEFVQGIAVVKTFGQAKKAYGRFLEETQRFIDFFWSWVRGVLHLSAATDIVLSPLFSLVVVLAAGSWFVGAGWIAPVDVLPFALLGIGLTAPILILGFSHNDMMLAKQAAERIAAVIDTPVLAEKTDGRVPDGTRVVYEGVGFSYDGRTDVLRDIDLVLEPGTLTALVGPSGSGKTTLARLLPRFWDPNAGRITLGGVPIDTLPSAQLYRQVGFVFQDVQLLRMSIRENIAMARPDAPIEEVEAVARAAQIHDRIVALPRGYDSVAGEDARLSGGEAQRVSIARAILADAPILVLDEATAFADPESEAAIQDALSSLIAGRTLLVIAHRLHTITGADTICVLDQGRIVERGRHPDLLAQGGLYARLWAAAERFDGVGPARPRAATEETVR